MSPSSCRGIEPAPQMAAQLSTSMDGRKIRNEEETDLCLQTPRSRQKLRQLLLRVAIPDQRKLMVAAQRHTRCCACRVDSWDEFSRSLLCANTEIVVGRIPAECHRRPATSRQTEMLQRRR